MGDLFNSDDIPVSWPKELPQLKNIDDRLHCPICYNYMKNPVMSTACSHNFCSLCIRNNISIKNSCPICFSEISDGMLRPNRCLEEIIKCFQPVKNYVLTTLVYTRNQLQENPPCSSSSQAKSEDLPEKSIHEENLSSSSFPSADEQSLNNYISSFLEPPSLSVTHQLPVASCSQSVVRTSKSIAHPPRQSSYKSKEVPCPVCNTLMRESVINIHLDSCLSSLKPAKRKPLPKMIYHLLKDQELRRKLRELGLSSTGDKATLINRHKKFTILYNSECDAVDPRPVEELREIFEQEEAENRRLANEQRYATAKIKTNDLEKIEEDNLQYLRNNKVSYDRLVNEIRQRPICTPLPPTTLPLLEEPPLFALLPVLSEEPLAVVIKNEPPKVESDGEEEVTEIYVPPKVYEMICLSDSSDSDEPHSLRPISADDNSKPLHSDYSIPDPMDSDSSKDSSSVGAQTITLSSSDASSRSSNSPTRYSPAGKSSDELLLFDQDSSSSTLLPSVQMKVSKKRSTSPSLNMADRKMSLRRRL